MLGAHEEAPQTRSVGLLRRRPWLLALFLELALDGVVPLALVRRRARGLFRARLTRAGRPVLLLRLVLLVHGLADLLSGRAQLVHRRLDALRVVALESLAQRRDLSFDVRLDVGRDLVAKVANGLLDLVRERIALVLGLDPLDVAAVLLGVGLRFLHELVDLIFVEAAGRGDRDVLLTPRRLVLRLHVDDAVRVDVKRDLDLRDTARRGCDAVEDEPREALVVRGELALALHHVDLHAWLRVAGRREGLRLRRGDGAVALDELGGDATQ